jgi:hypothetical protein
MREITRMKKYLTAVALLPLIAPYAANADPWKSPQECYNDHIRYAEGAYPQEGDDPSELRAYCQSAYEAKKCNFMCEVTRVYWDFAINAPKAQRHARVQGYLHTGKCSFWTLFTGRCGDGRDQ